MKFLRAEALRAGHILGGKAVERLVYNPGVKGPNKTPDAH